MQNEMEPASGGDEENNQILEDKGIWPHFAKATRGKWFWVVLILAVIATLSLAIWIKDHKKVEDQNKKEFVQQEVVDSTAEKKNEGDFTTIGETKSFTKAQLASANDAIEKGIKIDDPENDWLKVAKGTMQPDGKEDNSEPYPLPWSDIKSLSLGADSGYLYVKFQFWGNFPDKAFSYNGDVMGGGCAKLNNFSFANTAGKKDIADLILNVSLSEMSNGKVMGADLTSMISPASVDSHQETIFSIYSKEGLITKGLGEDYLLGAFPLNQLNLKLGDTVTFDVSSEVGSQKYHHEAIDLIFGRENEKFSDIIEYTLGSSTYSHIPQTNEKK